MSEQPDLSTLPQRMRYAATVLREASKRYKVSTWSPYGLEVLADQWESEDREAAEYEALALFLNSMSGGALAYSRSTARILINNGWRKGDPA